MIQPILIIGGGISGLTAGYELSKRGKRVVIIEKEPETGGLARSFKYGGSVFDIGPHRFYSEDPQVLSFIEDVLGDEYVRIGRHSGVYFFGKYYTWPLRPTALFNLPIRLTIKSIADLLRTKFWLHHGTALNFEEYVLKNYGPTLYNAFFKGYTEKFLGLEPKNTHYEWAKTGMKRAVINEDVASRNLFHIMRSMLLPYRTPKTEFIYPRRGIGQFCSALTERIKRRGGEVVTGDTIKKIYSSKGSIEAVETVKGARFEIESLIWTAPVDVLSGLLEDPPCSCSYLSMIVYNITVDKLLKKDYQWCYFGSKDIVFSRISIPSLFYQGSVPGSSDSICVEITCMENDPVWDDPEKMVPEITRDLIKAGLIQNRDNILDVHFEKISNAYPRYDIDYQTNFKKTKDGLTKYKNLLLAGRTGLFWYNNMDESIRNGIDTAAELC